MKTKTEKRTQIYLTADQHRRATEVAERSGISLASVVREALESYLARGDGEAPVSWEGDPFLALLGAGSLPRRGGVPLNEHIDRSLYEKA